MYQAVKTFRVMLFLCALRVFLCYLFLFIRAWLYVIEIMIIDVSAYALNVGTFLHILFHLKVLIRQTASKYSDFLKSNTEINI